MKRKRNLFILVLHLAILTQLGFRCFNDVTQPVNRSVIVNGSFEQVHGDRIVGWKWAHAHQRSRDAPPEGGNWSLLIVGTDWIGSAWQLVPQIHSGETWKLSCYARTESVWSGGLPRFGEARLSLTAQNLKGKMRMLSEVATSDSVWNLLELTVVVKLEEGETAAVVLSSYGGKWHTSYAYFDLVKAEKISVKGN